MASKDLLLMTFMKSSRVDHFISCQVRFQELLYLQKTTFLIKMKRYADIVTMSKSFVARVSQQLLEMAAGEEEEGNARQRPKTRSRRSICIRLRQYAR